MIRTNTVNSSHSFENLIVLPYLRSHTNACFRFCFGYPMQQLMPSYDMHEGGGEREGSRYDRGGGRGGVGCPDATGRLRAAI